MKTYLKSIFRTLKSNAARFVSMSVIMFLGIAFVGGLGTLSPTIKSSVSEVLDNAQIPDLIIKTTSPLGFSSDETSLIAGLNGVTHTQALTVAEFDNDGVSTRVYVYDDLEPELNALSVEGSLPSASGELLAERHSDRTLERAIGDKVTLFGEVFSVTGIVSNPMIFDRLGEPDLVSNEPLEDILYVCSSAVPLMPITDVYVRLDIEKRDFFSASYLSDIDGRKAYFSECLGDGFSVLTIKENKSYAVLDSYCKKVEVITLIFPVFFIAVAALVVTTTINRMIEEERAVIGCLKSLGMSDGKVILKYALLTIACCIAAGIAGLSAGLYILPTVIYPAFGSVMFLPPMSSILYPTAGFISFAFMAAAVTLIAVVSTKRSLKEAPAALLTAKAPKAGKKIFLEHIGFFWKRLSFKYKSAVRNIFRYKKHLIMTVVSVAGSTALAFAGFSLQNVADELGGTSFEGMKDSLIPISFVVIVFALLLCIFVIYNLTNLNIGERKRELATLKVLGYRDGEVLGYIYREIMIMAVLGALVGVLVGIGFVKFVLTYLEFGSLSDVKWYSYILGFSVVVLFVGIADLLLAKKILKIDMTTSLKSND